MYMFAIRRMLLTTLGSYSCRKRTLANPYVSVRRGIGNIQCITLSEVSMKRGLTLKVEVVRCSLQSGSGVATRALRAVQILAIVLGEVSPLTEM